MSIRFEGDGDIVKVDGTGSQRPPHRRAVWWPPRPPVGYKDRAPLGVQEGEAPGSKMNFTF